MRLLWASAPVLALGLGLAGCATPSGPARPALTGDPVVDAQNAIQYGPARDRVLWDYRLAAAALRRGQFDLARNTLDDALPRIGGMIGSDSEARKARSLFETESRKLFVGEPYERVMAYYYRGLLYWRDGELDNARACFRSAQFQDADTEEHAYAADYVLLDYLDGFCTTRLGGDGAQELKRAQANARGTSAPPPYHARANVMVFLEFGHGPVKYASGEHGEQLRFREGPAAARSVLLRLGAQAIPLVPYDDLFFQATTRGGRVMDHILANKAVFKNATSVAGDVGIITGVALATTGRNNEAAAIVGGLGLLSKIISAATTPAADIRAWDNLPRYLSFAPLELPVGTHPLAVEFLDADGRVRTSRSISCTVADPSKDTVFFISELNP